MGSIAHAIQWREPSLVDERQRRAAALKEFTQRLRQTVQPTCVILFGSVARGADRVESDLDLIVIGGQLPAGLFERLDVMSKLKRGLPVAIDAFPYTELEFEQMLDNLHVTALEAMRDGRPLEGEGYFARMRVKFDGLVKRGLSRSRQAWSLPPQLS
jgi:predicted nucleotidyltransferase